MRWTFICRLKLFSHSCVPLRSSRQQFSIINWSGTKWFSNERLIRTKNGLGCVPTDHCPASVRCKQSEWWIDGGASSDIACGGGEWWQSQWCRNISKQFILMAMFSNELTLQCTLLYLTDDVSTLRLMRLIHSRHYFARALKHTHTRTCTRNRKLH